MINELVVKMERPSIAHALAQRTPFSDLSVVFSSTTDMNSYLSAEGTELVPVVTNDVFEDLILWSAVSNDPELKSYVNHGLERKVGAGSADICGAFCSAALEHLPDRSNIMVTTLKEKLSRTGVLVRLEFAEYTVYDSVGAAHYQEALELLDLTDALGFDATYPFKKEAAAKAARVVCDNLEDSLELFGNFSGQSLVIFCLSIVELSNRHPKNLVVIREMCDAVWHTMNMYRGRESKRHGIEIIMELLEEYDMTNVVHLECRGEVQFAICMIEEAYGSSVTDFIEKNIGEIDDTVLDNMSYLMRSE